MKELYESTLDCVHCGLCLPACPTYDVLGLETDSPRGRIYLLRALDEGRIQDPASIRRHIDQCLGCRACETVCPSGVEYGRIFERGRERLAQSVGTSRLRKILLRHVVAHPGRLRLAFHAARAFELTGLRRLAEWLRLAPTPTRSLVPRVPKGRKRRPLSGTFEPTTGNAPRATVALFTGCVMGQLFGELNRKTLALLRAQGFRVVIPRQQVCCGALHRHDGDTATADRLVATNEQVFAGEDFEFLIHNSAGCGAALKESGTNVGERSRDVCEFLDEVGLVEPPQALPSPARVAYDDPCHLCHGQNVRGAPRRLLAQVPGLQFVAHEDPEGCCGSAGIYNLTQPVLAAEIGRRKVDSLIKSGADVVVTGNPGCILQIQAHAKERGSAIEVKHPVELLLPASALAEAIGQRV